MYVHLPLFFPQPAASIPKFAKEKSSWKSKKFAGEFAV